MFENENQSQANLNYPGMAHHSNLDNHSELRRKIPHYRSSGTMRDGMSPHNQDIHTSVFNQDIKQEDDFTPTSNYLADKPRMSLRERYYIVLNLSSVNAGKSKLTNFSNT